VSTAPFDLVPGDFVLQDFAARSASPRALAVFPREAVRSNWVPGTHPDVDSGRVRSTQPGDVPRGEVLSVYPASSEATGTAAARFKDRHARWGTHRIG
jgi:hypothetical protein